METDSYLKRYWLIRKTLFIFYMLIAGLYYGMGQTCCSGGIPLSNSLGLPIQKQGSFQVGISYDYNYLNTLNIGSEKVSDNNRQRITHSGLFNIGYSITDHLAVEGLLTWVNQRRNIQHLQSDNLDQTRGIGDGVLLMRYNFERVFKSNANLNIGVGTKIPIGSSTETNDLGIILNADLQPGSNSWDMIYWSEFSIPMNFRPSMVVSARLVFRETGTNTSYFGNSSYKFGNVLQSYIGVSDQYVLGNILITPGLTMKYRTAKKDEIGGFDLENTGGNWISVQPNVALNLTQSLVFTTKVEIPLHSDVDGTQLTPTFRLTTGLIFQLSKNAFINKS